MRQKRDTTQVSLGHIFKIELNPESNQNWCHQHQAWVKLQLALCLLLLMILQFYHIHILLQSVTHLICSLLCFSVDQSQMSLCDPIDCSSPSPSQGTCSNSCPLSLWCHPTISSSVVPFSFCPPSFPASFPGLFQWVSSWHQVAKVLDLQFHHQSFQWMFRVDFL